MLGDTNKTNTNNTKQAWPPNTGRQAPVQQWLQNGPKLFNPQVRFDALFLAKSGVFELLFDQFALGDPTRSSYP